MPWESCYIVKKFSGSVILLRIYLIEAHFVNTHKLDMPITNQANLPIVGKGAGRHFFRPVAALKSGQMIVLALMALLGLPAHAADVFLKAKDALNTSSVTGSANWSNSHRPGAGNTYRATNANHDSPGCAHRASKNRL